jgi:hypothetical protein
MTTDIVHMPSSSPMRPSGAPIAPSRRVADPMEPLRRMINPLMEAKRLADALDAIDARAIEVKLPAWPAPAPHVLAQLPSEYQIEAALKFLEAALEERSRSQDARLLVGVYLDCLGRKAGDNAQHVISGLVNVVHDDCSFDEDFDQSVPISTAALALALRRLMRDNKFIPAPAELREACITARTSIEKVFERLRVIWDEGPAGMLIWDLTNRAKRKAALDAGKQWDDDWGCVEDELDPP